jgi:uncharacterized protein YggE
MIPIHGCQAAGAASTASARRGPAGRPGHPARVSFTVTRHEVIRAMTQTLINAGVSAEALADTAGRTSRRILACLPAARPAAPPPERRTKSASSSPPPPDACPATTGTATITLYRSD